MALACSAPEARVRPTLDALGLSDRLTGIVTAEDVARGRPDPEAILYAAQQLGRPPIRCVLIGVSLRMPQPLACLRRPACLRTRSSRGCNLCVLCRASIAVGFDVPEDSYEGLPAAPVQVSCIRCLELPSVRPRPPSSLCLQSAAVTSC